MAHCVLYGVTGRIFLNDDVFLSLGLVIILANSADIDEMQLKFGGITSGIPVFSSGNTNGNQL